MFAPAKFTTCAPALRRRITPTSTSFARQELPVAKVIGIPSLKRKLDRLRKQVGPQLGAPMEEVAQRITSDMKNLVPVRFGDLRESIGWTWGDAPKGSVFSKKVRAAQKRFNEGRLVLTIFAGDEKAFYARFIEFGTQSHSLVRNASVARGLRQTGGATHPGTRAQ